eukprot:CAMPEP_0184967628 /NCGR_PEP_ID=MMETSP1098-20130426/932_1 /TAXON_ID=89044 /ORGANISM="Spumella elongata, Strain CCAP 955/1" /LENGTH=720 /DNA_ID=CAMNT_0027489109 /DNA_START=93 /DNA_END=2255 /DNA_ORIENTATION=+
MFSFLQTSQVYPSALNNGSADALSDASGDEVIDLHGDQFHETKDVTFKLTSWDIWALGLSTTLGGHFYLWSTGLVTGFGGMAVQTFLIFTGYAVLLLCMAELASALPFAGGAYGVARVTLGSFIGFLVACFDAYQSMFYAFFVVFVVGALLELILETDHDFQPVWWAIIYSSYILIHAWGGRTYWVILRVLTVGSLGLLLIYIFGCIKFAEFDKYAPMPAADKDIESVWFVGGAKLFFRALPFPCFFFVGNESLNLAARDTKNPKVDIPWGYFTTFTTNSLLTFALIFVACSVAPGTIYLPLYAVAPLTPGYMLLFDIDIYKALCLSLVPMYTAGFGFTYYSAYQIRAMGKSGLVNTWLGYDYPYVTTPVNALLASAAIGFLVGCRYFYLPLLKQEDLFRINLLGAVCVYFTQFISFIAFRWYYPTISREFTSPLGIFGAVYGIVFFIIVFVALAALEPSPAILAFAVYLALLTIYYVLVVRHRQMFSEEEKTVLFKAYLMKTNRQKQDRIRQGKRQPLTTTQSLLASFTNFFHSPAPAVSKNVNLASDSNSASITNARPKPGRRAQEYAEVSVQSGGEGSTTRLYGASAKVPRTASIGEDAPTHDRILELAPLSSSSYAALSSDETHTPPNLIPHITYSNKNTASNHTTSNNTSAHTDSLGHTHTPIVDLEANVPGAFADENVAEDGKTSEKGASFRYSLTLPSRCEFPNQELDEQADS